MIKCVIFDCDGTLVDSETLSSEALSIKLAEYNIFEPSFKLTDQNRGAKFVDVLKRLTIEHQVTFKDSFVAEFRALVAALFADKLQAFPDVQGALSALNVAVCVASNAPADQLQLALQTTGLEKYFNAKVYSAYTVKSWKPAPGVFLYAAAEMGYPAHQCLVVEDSPVGIAAGKAAGMLTVLFDPVGLYPDLPFDFKITSMQELPALVAELSQKT